MKTITQKLLLLLLLVASALVSVAPVGAVTTAPAPTTMTTDDYFLYIPKSANTGRPLQLLVTIHGMGGEGRGFCDNLLAQAEQNGWVIVSPTFHYRDYRVVANVVQDEMTMMPRLRAIIDELPGRTGLAFQPKVLMYGFSRGAQMVHRFAQWYPERVMAVALFSAGSYTLPRTAMTANGAAMNMSYPFGVADLGKYNGSFFNEAAYRRVGFYVGVGGADARTGDVPRDWDATQGDNRVARAQNFYNSLASLNMAATMELFPGIGHDVNAQMRAAAMHYLKQQAELYAIWGF